MTFEANVVTQCDFEELDSQIANKINEIAQDAGRGSHGPVMLTDGTTHQHWRAGSYRIFGTYENDLLTVVGWGDHTGTGNSSYKVQLCDGDTTKAKTT